MTKALFWVALVLILAGVVQHSSHALAQEQEKQASAARAESQAAIDDKLVSIARAQIDREAIANIQTKGIGKRPVVDALTNNEKNSSKFSTFQEFLVLMNNRIVKHEAPFPLQKYVLSSGKVTEVTPTIDDHVMSLPDGGTVHFAGTNEWRGNIFQGTNGAPLCFVLFRKVGLVYVSGDGQVRLKDGKTIMLPSGKKSSK